MEAARTMLHEQSFPKKLWAEAISTSVFVLNRPGKSHENGRSPFEVWTNKRFDIHQLKVFGFEVYVHIPKEQRKKWDVKGEKGLMVGYDDNMKGYRIYFPKNNMVLTKRDVVFLNRENKDKKLQMKEGKEKESTISVILKEENNPEFDANPVNEVNSDETLEATACNSIGDGSENECDSEYLPCSDEERLIEEIGSPIQERSKRVRKQTYKCNNVSKLGESECEPFTYTVAMNRSDAHKWSETIASELQTLKENDTWDLCDAPGNMKVITSKWVIKLKNVNNDVKYKARLVARGFEQQESF